MNTPSYRMISKVLAGPLKVTRFQLKSPFETEWQEEQIHMVFNNGVMATLLRSTVEELDKFMKRLEKQPVPVPVRIDLTDKVTVELFHEGEDNATIISVYEQGVVRARLGESSAKLISSYLKDPREKDQ